MASGITHDLNWRDIEQKFHAICLRHFLLELVGGHFGLTATIGQHSLLCPQPLSLRDSITGRVPALDHNNAIATRHRLPGPPVNLFNEMNGIDNFREIFPGNVEPRPPAKANTNED